MLAHLSKIQDSFVNRWSWYVLNFNPQQVVKWVFDANQKHVCKRNGKYRMYLSQENFR